MAAALPILMGVQLLGGIMQARASAKAVAAQNQANAASAAAASAAATHQAAVEKHKAQVLELQAKDAISRGAQEQTRHQLKTAQLKGSQRARFAAAGLDLSEGSAFNVLMDTEFLGKTDELTIADNAAREAWAYRESAKTGIAASEFLTRHAKTVSAFSTSDPREAAFTSLLSSAGQIGASFYNMTGGMRGGGGASPLTSYGSGWQGSPGDYGSGGMY